jgi:hypothetical protein
MRARHFLVHASHSTPLYLDLTPGPPHGSPGLLAFSLLPVVRYVAQSRDISLQAVSTLMRRKRVPASDAGLASSGRLRALRVRTGIDFD